MKTFTIEDIRDWGPCYDPNRCLPEDWEGTAIDILKHKDIPPQDRLWVVCRENLIDAKTLRLFAVWCARQVEPLMEDERSKKALDVAEAYAHGNATDDELAAAWAAVMDTTENVARVAAEAAAEAAARAATKDATKDVAWEAAEAAAWNAAWDAAQQKQVEKLIEMLSGENQKMTIPKILLWFCFGLTAIVGLYLVGV